MTQFGYAEPHLHVGSFFSTRSQRGLHRQRDVPMPALPVAHFVVIQAAFAFTAWRKSDSLETFSPSCEAVSLVTEPRPLILAPVFTPYGRGRFSICGRPVRAAGRRIQGPSFRRSSWGRLPAFWRPRLQDGGVEGPGGFDAVAVEKRVWSPSMASSRGARSRWRWICRRPTRSRSPCSRGRQSLRGGGHLGAEAKGDAFVGLDADGEQVGLDLLAGAAVACG